MDRIPSLLLVAFLLPLASFAIISIGYSVPQFFGIRVRYATQKYASYIAVGAIVFGCVLSMYAMFACWLPNNPLKSAEEHESHAEHTAQASPLQPAGTPFKLVAQEQPEP